MIAYLDVAGGLTIFFLAECPDAESCIVENRQTGQKADADGAKAEHGV